MKKELNWTAPDEEKSSFDYLSEFMCSWNDYTQGLRTSNPSRLYKFVSPQVLYNAVPAALELGSTADLKMKQKKRALLCVKHMEVAISNFRHLKEIGVLDENAPYWSYLSQYVHKKLVAALNDYEKQDYFGVFRPRVAQKNPEKE